MLHQFAFDFGVSGNGVWDNNGTDGEDVLVLLKPDAWKQNIIQTNSISHIRSSTLC